MAAVTSKRLFVFFLWSLCLSHSTNAHIMAGNICWGCNYQGLFSNILLSPCRWPGVMQTAKGELVVTVVYCMRLLINVEYLLNIKDIYIHHTYIHKEQCHCCCHYSYENLIVSVSTGSF